jgi:hypothetical protein
MTLYKRLFLYCAILLGILPDARAHEKIPSSTTRAQCTNTNIQIDALGAIRNQGEDGLCFAFEGADLLSFKFGTRISALDVALAYYNTTHYKSFAEIYKHGGDTPPALREEFNLGLCPETALPSDEAKIDMSAGAAGKIQAAIFALEQSYKTGNQRGGDFLTFLPVAQSVFPHIRAADLASAYAAATTKEFLQSLVSANCHGQRILAPALALKHHRVPFPDHGAKLLPIVNGEIDKGNLVGIGYDTTRLYRQSLQLFGNRATDFHASTIIGRRWNEEKDNCEYLIRDSFGGDCRIYRQNFICDQGNVWLPEKYLARHLYEIEYFPAH